MRVSVNDCRLFILGIAAIISLFERLLPSTCVCDITKEQSFCFLGGGRCHRYQIFWEQAQWAFCGGSIQNSIVLATYLLMGNMGLTNRP